MAQTHSQTTDTERIVLSALRSIGVEDKRFFGIVSLHYQNGELTVIRREQTLKPNLIERKNLSDDSQHRSTD